MLSDWSPDDLFPQFIPLLLSMLICSAPWTDFGLLSLPDSLRSFKRTRWLPTGALPDLVAFVLLLIVLWSFSWPFDVTFRWLFDWSCCLISEWDLLVVNRYLEEAGSSSFAGDEVTRTTVLIPPSLRFGSCGFTSSIKSSKAFFETWVFGCFEIPISELLIFAAESKLYSLFE